jgi:predicted ATPase
MFITNLRLNNWRNFRSINTKLGERTFLAGPNASGKSNLLDAIRFLRDIAKPGGGLQKAVSDRGGISKIRCLAARSHPDVEIEIALGDSPDVDPIWKYGVGIKQETRGYRNPYLSYEKVWHEGKVILGRPIPEDVEDAARLTQTHLEQINSNKQFRDVTRFLESIKYLHLVPQLVRHADAYSGPGIPGDPFGRSFLELVMRTPSLTRRARLRKIESALLPAVPQLKALADVMDDGGKPHLEAIYEHWRAKGAKQREDQFSDGTLRLIGLLWAILEGASVLLLEEPELSLNGAIVKRLPSLIHRIQRQRKRQAGQVIISTHSADLLSDKGIGGSEVLLLTPSSEGTGVEQASSIEEIRTLLEEGYSIAEAILPRIVPPNIGQLDLFE